MAAQAAVKVAGGADTKELRASLQTMQAMVRQPARFRGADVAFHGAVIALSGNRLSGSIARVLIEEAIDSSRYRGNDPGGHFDQTLREHEAIAEAVLRGDPSAAKEAMDSHIRDSWARRRLPVAGEAEV